MIFLTFANGWKYRENRDKQIPQNFETYHTVTLPGWKSLEIPVECAACLLKTSRYFTPKYAIFLDPISDLNCCSH